MSLVTQAIWSPFIFLLMEDYVLFSLLFFLCFQIYSSHSLLWLSSEGSCHLWNILVTVNPCDVRRSTLLWKMHHSTPTSRRVTGHFSGHTAKSPLRISGWIASPPSSGEELRFLLHSRCLLMAHGDRKSIRSASPGTGCQGKKTPGFNYKAYEGSGNIRSQGHLRMALLFGDLIIVSAKYIF